jgi:enoyl-CoA hydratase
MPGGTTELTGLTEPAAGVPFPTVPLEVVRHAAGPALDRLPHPPRGAVACTRPLDLRR